MKNSIFLILFIHSILLQAQVNKNVAKKINQPDKLRSALSTVSIQPDVLEEWLCPEKLLRGDREFGGNGPKIKCEAKLKINRDSTALEVEFYLWAQETVQDWSTTEGKWIRKIYDAPYGKKINKIISDKASRTQFISPKAGFQIIAPGADVAQALYGFLDHTDIKSAVLKEFGVKPGDKSALSNLVKHYVDKGNQVVKVPPVEGTLVKFFYIVGDTGGDDISTDSNCNDDTRIHKIEFFPIRIELR